MSAPTYIWVAIYRHSRLAFRFCATSKRALLARLNHDTGGRAADYDLIRYEHPPRESR